MNRKRIRLLVTDLQTMKGTFTSLEQFAADNRDDPELIIDCECLAVGFGFDIGGGAAPRFAISRWSDYQC